MCQGKWIYIALSQIDRVDVAMERRDVALLSARLMMYFKFRLEDPK
jgi:hypothetical protein